MMDRWA